MKTQKELILALQSESREKPISQLHNQAGGVPSYS
jgi:hypothetical protein